MTELVTFYGERPGSSATFSVCGEYRLRLDRAAPQGLLASPPTITAMVCMVNPSKGGHDKNDSTITKIDGFMARSPRPIGRYCIGNKFALVSTDVRALARHPDPIGAGNDLELATMMLEVDIIIPAWGTLSKLPVRLRNRWREIVAMARTYKRPLYCWGTCKDGQPRHPLMTPYDTPLTEWEPPL